MPQNNKAFPGLLVFSSCFETAILFINESHLELYLCSYDVNLPLPLAGTERLSFQPQLSSQKINISFRFLLLLFKQLQFLFLNLSDCMY